MIQTRMKFNMEINLHEEKALFALSPLQDTLRKQKGTL